MSVPLTACIICFNETENIRACLESVAFCEAIVVVDSHSSDDTRSIAQEFTDKVYERDWPGHIAQKNFAIEQAETEWVLCLDADERVTPELRRNLEQMFADGPAHDGYEINRRTHYLGRFIDHGGFYPDRKLRIFRRDKGRWGGTNPHDHVDLTGRSARLPGDLEHYSYRDIADHLKTIDYFTTIISQEKLAKGGAILPKLIFAPPWKFLQMYVLKLGFLDGIPGLIVAFLGSYYVMLKYAKLWELVAVKGRLAGGGEAVLYGRKGE